MPLDLKAEIRNRIASIDAERRKQLEAEQQAKSQRDERADKLKSAIDAAWAQIKPEVHRRGINELAVDITPQSRELAKLHAVLTKTMEREAKRPPELLFQVVEGGGLKVWATADRTFGFRERVISEQDEETQVAETLVDYVTGVLWLLPSKG